MHRWHGCRGYLSLYHLTHLHPPCRTPAKSSFTLTNPPVEALTNAFIACPPCELAPPIMETTGLHHFEFYKDTGGKEDRGGELAGLCRRTLLSDADWRSSHKSLSNNRETGIRSHLNCLAGARHAVSLQLLSQAIGVRTLAELNSCRRYVALKIFIASAAMGHQLDDELNIYARLSSKSTAHPGRPAIRSLLDRFSIDGPTDIHQCLVHVPLWENVWTFLHRNPIQRLPTPVLAFVLQRVFLALDYLHTECQIIHTGKSSEYI